jgi:hypothetical protein
VHQSPEKTPGSAAVELAQVDKPLWVNTGLIPFLVKFTLLILVLWSVIAPGEMSDHQEALSTD